MRGKDWVLHTANACIVSDRGSDDNDGGGGSR